MPKARPSVVELFCGVGGMSLGFKQAGFDLLAAVDNDPLNVEYHHLNFPGCATLQGDLSKMTGSEIRKQAKLGDRKINLVIGGPPCQGFSLIGKRNPRDRRNRLIYHFIRIVAELEADHFVLENVGGLTAGHGKRVLKKFIGRANQSGYCVVTPVKVLDACHFGVPQRRRRVFVLGYRKGKAMPEYPTPLSDHAPTVVDAIGDLPHITPTNESFVSDVFVGTLGSPSAYATMLRGDRRKCSRKGKGWRSTRLTGCLLTHHTRKTIARFAKTKPGQTEKVSRYHRLKANGVASTLRAGTGPDRGSYMAARPIHPTENRCITVREGARLHSFPDTFHFHPTKWHGFRQIGNSVPPLLARSVAKSVRRATFCTP